MLSIPFSISLRVYVSHNVGGFSSLSISTHCNALISKKIGRAFSLDLNKFFQGFLNILECNFQHFFTWSKCLLFSLCLPECRWIKYSIINQKQHLYFLAFSGTLSILFLTICHYYYAISKNCVKNNQPYVTNMPPIMLVSNTIVSLFSTL